MKVFISYGSGPDQVTALRLQALAAVNGLTVYVPPAYTRQPSFVLPDTETAQKLKDADTILGIVGAELSETCRQELFAGRALNKPTIVMTGFVAAPHLEPYFGADMVIIDPLNPARTEFEIVEHLKTRNASQQATTALTALGTLALGLLIFAPQD